MFYTIFYFVFCSIFSNYSTLIKCNVKEEFKTTCSKSSDLDFLTENELFFGNDGSISTQGALLDMNSTAFNLNVCGENETFRYIFCFYSCVGGTKVSNEGRTLLGTGHNIMFQVKSIPTSKIPANEDISCQQSISCDNPQPAPGSIFGEVPATFRRHSDRIVNALKEKDINLRIEEDYTFQLKKFSCEFIEFVKKEGNFRFRNK